MQDLNNRLERCIEFAMTESRIGNSKDTLIELYDTGVVFLNYASDFFSNITEERIKEAYTNPSVESLFDFLNLVEQTQHELKYVSSKNPEKEKIKQELLGLDVEKYRTQSAEVVTQLYLRQAERAISKVVDKNRILEVEFEDGVFDEDDRYLAEVHPFKFEKNEIGGEDFIRGIFVDKHGILYEEHGDDFDPIGVSQAAIAQIVNEFPEEDTGIVVNYLVQGKLVSEQRGDIFYVELEQGKPIEMLNISNNFEVLNPHSDIEMLLDSENKLFSFVQERAVAREDWIVTENGRVFPELKPYRVEIGTEVLEPDESGLVEIYSVPTLGLEERTLVGLYDTQSGELLKEKGFAIYVNQGNGLPEFRVYKEFMTAKIKDYKEGRLGFVDDVLSGKIDEDEKRAIEMANLGYDPSKIDEASDYLQKARELITQQRLNNLQYAEKIDDISTKINSF